MSNPEESTKNPTKLSVSARLESLKGLKSPKKRPQAALLTENLASIENSLLEGFSRQDVWEALREEGFTLTFESFLLSLHRIRKKRAATKQSPQRPEAPKPTAHTTSPTKPSVATLSAPKPQPTTAQSTTEEEDDKAYEEFKKSVAHLPIVQRSKKLSDFMEKQQDARPNYNTRKLLGLGEFAKPAETSPTPETPISEEKSELQKKQEAYKAYKESLPNNLSTREYTKLLEKWRHDWENKF